MEELGLFNSVDIGLTMTKKNKKCVRMQEEVTSAMWKYSIVVKMYDNTVAGCKLCHAKDFCGGTELGKFNVSKPIMCLK